ncbi:MAG: hypothetical protein LBF68_06275 [Christensenellaceae bacterium]|nr:hypothetical protein [Christensenellaceae bacterium]
MLSFSALIDLAAAYQNNGYNLLTFNLKAHDCIAEGVYANGFDTKEEFYYVGGSLEPFERRYVDIQCAINFVKSFSNKIVLQGHSMGCESIIAHQITSGQNYDTILLSPCDAYRLQMDYIYPKTVAELIDELDNYPDNELLPAYFFGINTPTYTNIGRYTIPIYKKAMHSILTGLALKIFRQDKNFEYHLPIRCLCVLGRKDPMQTYMPKHAFDVLNSKFDEFLGVELNGDHELKPEQEELIKNILHWLR